MMNETIEKIRLDNIEPHPANRRIGGFDQAKLEQLAESIKAVGVQQPAVVRKMRSVGDITYQLVAGERRWRASRIAGLDYLPCVVRDLDDVTALKIQTIENLQRDDVHPLDEADGYNQLVEQAGYTIEMIAADVGKSTSYIYQRMKLNSLIDDARNLFVENTITAGHAILIARLGPDQQALILEEGLFDYDVDAVSVRDLDGFIHNHIMLELSTATWKLDDAELLPDAGSCRECPKRTGYQPALFADVCNEGKKDYCTDRACFTRKQIRVVEIKKAELEGQDIIEVVDGYNSITPVTKDAVPYYAWTECKKSAPGAKKVLVVAGNRPGRTTYGIIISQQLRYQQSPEDKAKIKKEREKEKAAEDLRLAKTNAVLEAAVTAGGALPLEVLRICVKQIWDTRGHDSRVAIAKLEGWITKGGNPHGEGEKRIMDKKISDTALYRLLLLMIMIGEIKCPSYCIPSSEKIDALMEVYQVETPPPPEKKSKKKEA